MPSLSLSEFRACVDEARPAADGATLVIPLSVRLLADQLTPVLAYRRLVAPDARTAPSFLLESVEEQTRQGRYSILGSRPLVEVVAHNRITTVHDRRPNAGRPRTDRRADPFELLRSMSARMHLVEPKASIDRSELPESPWGGWFGYASYDTVRYAEPEKLDPRNAPEDDRRLPDLHFGFYDGVVVFDNAAKLVFLVQLCFVGSDDDPDAVYQGAIARLDERAEEIQRHSKPLASGRVSSVTDSGAMASNTTRASYDAMIDRALEYIRAGDIFQVVLGQRFERKSAVDPFDVYRSLRAVNPSPYMSYIQTPQCILVASSPEILCRVERIRQPGEKDKLILTNRPLAGTRKRGKTPEEDKALEEELLADPKERAEHVMLLDLGRNDVGRVAKPGTVTPSDVMSIERYSHVMHISSTVKGELRDGLDAWDALRATLPVGTISGAPKIRAMQIIDELEPVRRGPYGGGLGYVGIDGSMDIALALRTIVAPTGPRGITAEHEAGPPPGGVWTYHIQAAGGIVADSKKDAEYQETVNKAAALAKAIDLAEQAFGGPKPVGTPPSFDPDASP